MRDAQCAQVEDERGAFDAFDDFGVLMDGHVIDKRVFDARADFVPVRAIIRQAAQDHGVAQDDLDGIMVEHLFADRDHIADHVRVGIPSRPQWIGDDSRSFTGGDEKEIVAEVLNRRVDIRRVGKRANPARHVGITASRLRGEGKDEQRTDENYRTED